MTRGTRVLLLVLGCLVLAVLVSSVGVFARTKKAETQPADVRLAAISPASGGVPFANLRDGSLYSADGQAFPLKIPAVAPLMGWISPVGVFSPDGSQVAYNAWDTVREVDPHFSASHQGLKVGDVVATPSIRMVDTSTGADSVLADGAYSLAWRADGTMAYVQGRSAPYLFDVPYVGNIVVRAPGSDTGETWSSGTDRYIVTAWAGQTLLAYREREGEALDLLAFDGPDQERLLGTDTTLVSVSPDGTRALVFDHASYPPTVRLLDIATGKELGNTDLFSAIPKDQPNYPHLLSYGGDWTGDYAVADSDVGLVRLHIVGNDVSVTDVLGFASTDFPIAPHEPQFIQGSDSRVQVWAPTDTNNVRTYRFLTCDFATSACEVGDTNTSSNFSEVHNPSRPLNGGR